MAASVADTSILAAILFREPRADEAGDLIADTQLYEPPLLAYELASVCRKKCLQYPRKQNQLLQALEIGLSLDIQWLEVEQLAIVALSVESDLTTYDATFLWTARALGIPLYTFDDRLRSAASR
jgi:predicted nucleic acid-binding protein